MTPKETSQGKKLELLQKKDWLEYPIFICGAPRSGTTLLVQLLDGHPELLVLPLETHLLQYEHEQRTNFANFLCDGYSKTHDIRMFTDLEYRSQFGDYMTRNYGPGPDNSFNLDVVAGEVFGSRYLTYLTDHGATLKTAYQAHGDALFAATNHEDGSLKAFVEKRPLDNELSTEELKSAFPHAKFIHILRDPRTRYISAKKRRISRRKKTGFAQACLGLNGLDFARALSEIATVSFLLAAENQARFKEDYLVIRYEDLLADRSQIMREVGSFLGITYGESLCVQTAMGRPAYPHSSFALQTSNRVNVPSERLEAYYSATTRLERKIIDLYCSHSAAKFRYSLPIPKQIRLVDLFGRLANEVPFAIPTNRLKMLTELVGKPPEEVSHGAYLRLKTRWTNGFPCGD